MKYFKRSGLYKASNVTFDPKNIRAYSYDWWCFVKIINNKVIFNNYRYSNSTTKHQYKVRGLLHELGINIDRFVQVRCGLQNIDTLKDLNIAENDTLVEIERHEEQKRLNRNKRARERRAMKKANAQLLAKDAKRILRLV